MKKFIIIVGLLIGSSANAVLVPVIPGSGNSTDAIPPISTPPEPTESSEPSMPVRSYGDEIDDLKVDINGLVQSMDKQIEELREENMALAKELKELQIEVGLIKEYQMSILDLVRNILSIVK